MIVRALVVVFALLMAMVPGLSAELPMLSQYVHRQWTMEQGLPQNSISDIVQAEDGFLWLATQEGLVRFDGFVFRNDNKLVADQSFADVRQLHIDRDQRLWLSLYRGLAQVSPSGEVVYALDDTTLNQSKLRAIAQDGQGGLWLGSLDGKLFRLKGNQVRSFEFPGLTDISCFESYRETLWIGTYGYGLFVFEKGIFQRYDVDQGLDNNHINALQLDHRGVLWIGTNSGIYTLARGKVTQVYHDSEALQWNRVTSLLEGAGDLFWAGTHSGLMRLRRERGKLYREDILELGEVTTLFEDQQGYLWVGTQGNGLHQLRTGTFKTVSHRQGLPHNSTWAIYNAEGDTIYAATEAYGLAVIERDRAAWVSEPEKLKDVDIATITDDGEGGLWVGGFDGLFHWQPGKPLVQIQVGNAEGNYVYPVYRDRDNRVLFGTMEGLYVLYPGDEKPILFLKHKALNAEFLRDVAEDEQGRLWFATSDGLFSYWQDELNQFDPQNSQLRKKSINALHVDRENRLWAAYEGGGILLYDGTAFKSFMSEQGFWEPELYNIIDDGVGSLWMASNNGIFKAGKRELMDAMARGEALIEYRHFTEKHGLLTRECNFGGLPSVTRDGTGRLWFATLGGVAVVDPTKTSTFFKPAKLYIDRIEVDGVALPGSGSEWSLPSTFDELAVHYSALDFVEGKELAFKTRLEGLSEKWVDAGTQRVAYYSQLPPGNYRFHLALEDHAEVEPLMVQLKLKAPIWAYPVVSVSLPFVVLGLVLLAVIWLLRRRRSSVAGLDYKLTHQNQEIDYVQEKIQDTEAAIGQNLNLLRDGQDSTAKLHNIGNVMNSFSVSASLIEKALRSTDLDRTTAKVIQLLSEHQAALGAFVCGDARGPKVIDALADLHDLREENREDLLQEVANLHMQCGHLKDILQGVGGQTKKGPEMADLNILVEDAVKIQSHALRKHGIEVLQELHPLPPASLAKAELLQVLVNLIKNAYEAIRMNDMDNPQRIRLRTFVEEDGEHVVLEVFDTGVGITAEHQQKLFSHGFTTKPDGHGFGLHYCQNVVRQMGGNIEASSEGEGRGAMFRLSLPVAAKGVASEPLEQGL